MDVKSVDSCRKIGDKMANEINNTTVVSGTPKIKSKLALDSITLYNYNLATQKESSKSVICKLLRHERLYKIMKAGSVSSDNSLWFYLDHFSSDCAQQIEIMVALVEENDRLHGTKSETYKEKYLSHSFEGYD